MTIELKALIDRMLPADELERLWKKKLYSKGEWVAMKALELAADVSKRQTEDGG